MTGYEPEKEDKLSNDSTSYPLSRGKRQISGEEEELQVKWWHYFFSKDFWLINAYWLIGGLFLLFVCLKIIIPIFTNPGKVKPLPKWEGKKLNQVVKEIEEWGLTAKIDSTYVLGKPPLVVLKQIPPAGKKVKTNSGRTIYLTVNQVTPPYVDDIPCYEHFIHIDDYKYLLRQKGLEIGRLIEVPISGADAPGRVLKVAFKGKEIHCRRSEVAPSDSILILPPRLLRIGDKVDVYIVAQSFEEKNIDEIILQDLQKGIENKDD